jgi:hypothetical protein
MVNSLCLKRPRAQELYTGVDGLDRFVAGFSLAEIYGEWNTVNNLFHTVLSQTGGDVILTQKFGGLDPYLISRMSAARFSRPRIRLIRAFSTKDTIESLNQCVGEVKEPLFVIDPYLYSPKTWREYSELTPLTAALRDASKSRNVMVFNRITRFGSLSPEGGMFHASSIPVLIRVESLRRTLRFTVVKHPALPNLTIHVDKRILSGETVWEEQLPLTEWL